MRPEQRFFHVFAEGNVVKYPMTARDKDTDIITRIQILHYLSQLFRLLELTAIFLIGGLDRRILTRECPHLKLYRVAGWRCNVDFESGKIDVVHGQ